MALCLQSTTTTVTAWARRVGAHYVNQPHKEMQTYVTALAWWKLDTGFEHEFVIATISYLESNGERQTAHLRLERSILNDFGKVSTNHHEHPTGVNDK